MGNKTDRLKLVALVWLAIACAAASLVGPAPAEAQEPRVIRASVADGVRFYRNGAWGIVVSEIANPSDQPIDVLISTAFDSERTSVQYASRVWIPPHSRRRVQQVVRAVDIRTVNRGVETTTLLLGPSASADIELAPRSTALLVVEERRPTLVSIVTDPSTDLLDIGSYVIERSGTTGRTTLFRTTRMPSQDPAWDAVDLVMLGDELLAFNPAQMGALRRWLLGGGRIWLMLERMDPALISRLLGDDWPVEVVDHVQLAQFAIEGGMATGEADMDEPATMARVLAPGMTVMHTVDGWPASMYRNVGRGKVLVTTLGWDGWEAASADRDNQETPLAELSRWFAQRVEPPAITTAQLQPFTTGQIGHSIMNRRPVVMVIGTFTLALLMFGFLLARGDRLEHIGWIAASMALIATIAVIVLGHRHSTSTPLTLASTQFVQVVPNQQHAVLTGSLDVYSPLENVGPLSSTRGRVMWPTDAGRHGEVPRMVWTDMDRWHWNGLKLPSGAVRSSTYSHVVSLGSPVSATARFGPTGLSIDLTPGPFEELTDMVVATQVGAATPQLVSPGVLMVSPDDVLRPGVFISGSIDDVRGRRQQVYEDVLVRSWTEPDQAGFPQQPMLMGWSRGPRHGFMVPQEGATHRDASLVAIPLIFEQPEPDTRVLVPSALLPFKEVRGVGGHLVAGVFMYETNSWRGDMRGGTTMTMRFEMPPELLPLKVERAVLSGALRAPARDVEVRNAHRPDDPPLEVWRNAAGNVSATIRNSDALQPDENGHIYVVIRVPESDFASRQDWNLSGLWLEIEGVHQPARSVPRN